MKTTPFTLIFLSIIITLVTGFKAYAQFDATIKFKNGAVITDKVKYLHNREVFKSKTTKKKYRFRDISEMLINIDNKPRHLFFLDVKKSVRHRTGYNSGIGLLIYQNKMIELFHIWFGPNAFERSLIASPRFSGFISQRRDRYIRKKGEEFVYSIGPMDGHGNFKIKERLNNFFSDCPELMKMIEDGKIDKLDTIKICDYYNKLCGTD